MKKALAAVLAATAVTGAAVSPAHAARTVHVQQGMMITSDQGARCSLTIVSPTTGYTAKHCGHHKWTEGHSITNGGGTPIGTIDGIGSGTGRDPIDAVRITFTPNAQVESVPGVRNPNEVTSQETIRTQGMMSRFSGKLNDHRRYITRNHAFPSVFMIGDVGSTQGDSGGAVLDSSGRVLGIIKSGVTIHDTNFVPIDLIQKYLPAS